MGSQVNPPSANSVPFSLYRLATRIGGRVVVPFTLAATLSVAVIAWPGAGQIAWPRAEQVATNEAPGAPTLKVPKEQNAKAPPAKPWPAGTLEQALIGPSITLPAAAFPAPEAPQPMAAAIPLDPNAPAGARFGIGDRLKVMVYERVDDQEADKWGRGGSDLSGFQQRPEFGGEYSVESDGGITLPLLGQFRAAGRSARDLEGAIAASFQELTMHNGLVTIALVDRPPIYVLGPVKNPGTYKFTAGLTVLHAIAMAGGFSGQNLEPWQQLEAIRELDKHRVSLQSLPKLLARVAVLKAERDGASPEVSSDLLQLVGKESAETLVAQEAERREGIVSARQAEKDALLSSLASAKQELQRLSTLQQPLDQLIQLKKERADAMKNLAKQGVVGRQLLIQAQADLADSEQRRQDALNQLAVAAKRQLSAGQQELARFEANIRITLENEMVALDQQIRTADGDATSSLNVLNALQPAGYAQPSEAAQVHFTIVRESATGPIEITASDLTELEPGDLVKINSPGADNGRAADMPVPSANNTILIRDTTP
jgi:exopolysaccharide production protein ExoF